MAVVAHVDRTGVVVLLSSECAEVLLRGEGVNIVVSERNGRLLGEIASGTLGLLERRWRGQAELVSVILQIFWEDELDILFDDGFAGPSLMALGTVKLA